MEQSKLLSKLLHIKTELVAVRCALPVAFKKIKLERNIQRPQWDIHEERRNFHTSYGNCFVGNTIHIKNIRS